MKLPSTTPVDGFEDAKCVLEQTGVAQLNNRERTALGFLFDFLNLQVSGNPEVSTPQNSTKP